MADCICNASAGPARGGEAEYSRSDTPPGTFFVNPLDLRDSGITTRIASYTGLLSRLLRFETLTCAKGDMPESISKGAAQMVMEGGVLELPLTGVLHI